MLNEATTGAINGAQMVTRPSPPAAEAYRGSSFASVWSAVQSDPYLSLPNYPVTLRSFFANFRARLLEAGRRTTRVDDDLLPSFRKLIRANGIALAGSWQIDDGSPYSGLFAAGTRALIIARASVALSETRRGHYRAFGLAGKIFPTLDPERQVKTANFFVIDDNGGTKLAHFLDASMTNEPPLSPNRESLAALPMLIAIAIAQRISDEHPGIRQLYPMSQAGLADPAQARTPRHLRVRGRPGFRSAAEDFRDEVRVSIARGAVAFELEVRDHAREPWRPIGRISFDDCVASDSADHRLHFPHPPWRSERSWR